MAPCSLFSVVTVGSPVLPPPPPPWFCGTTYDFSIYPVIFLFHPTLNSRVIFFGYYLWFYSLLVIFDHYLWFCSHTRDFWLLPVIFGHYQWFLVTTSDISDPSGLKPEMIIFEGRGGPRFWQKYHQQCGFFGGFTAINRKNLSVDKNPEENFLFNHSWYWRFQTPHISEPRRTFFRFSAVNPSIHPHCWWVFGQNRGFPLTCDFWSLPVTFDHYLWLFVTTYDFSLLPVILQSTCDFWSLPMIFCYYPGFFWSKRPQTRDDYFWPLPVIFLFPSWFWRRGGQYGGTYGNILFSPKRC